MLNRYSPLIRRWRTPLKINQGCVARQQKFFSHRFDGFAQIFFLCSSVKSVSDLFSPRFKEFARIIFSHGFNGFGQIFFLCSSVKSASDLFSPRFKGFARTIFSHRFDGFAQIFFLCSSVKSVSPTSSFLLPLLKYISEYLKLLFHLTCRQILACPTEGNHLYVQWLRNFRHWL